MLTTKLIGNLGNHLFELCSLTGIGLQHGEQIGYPEEWPHYECFKGPFKKMPAVGEALAEQQYPYHIWPVLPGHDQVLTGYRQSEKYWLQHEKQLRKLFEWKTDFKKDVLKKLPTDFYKKETICISVRRGDFVDNPTYYQLPAMYYIGALIEHFPDFENCNILIVSDDLAYCKVHFECLPNAFFADGLTPIEQLCAGSLCDNHIISNSTFSWWCAYLAEGKKVIRPKYNFGEAYRIKNPENDYWPDRNNWVVFEHEPYKINLSDTTFMIPVFHDHPDRKQNVDLNICMLMRDYQTNITIMEQGSNRFVYTKQWCKYMRHTGAVFHRTKMLNDMAKSSSTPILVNWDADVFVPPLQVYLSVKIIRSESAKFVYPYDGRFGRVTRKEWFKVLGKALDVGIFRDTVMFGKNGKEMATTSVGGAVFMDAIAFVQSGMENEYMISYGPEDCERWDRWHALGFTIKRITGKLFHLDHFVGGNSCSINPYFKGNEKELEKIRGFSEEGLFNYVRSWPWVKHFFVD